ncbi:MAG: thrombospondin type 3 repeat-containing protein, partial [Anaerolineae bacterium]
MLEADGEGTSSSRLRSIWRGLIGRREPKALLRLALERAQEAGTFRVDIDLQQTITLLNASPLGAPSEYARFRIEGTVGGRERARFSILPAAASFALATQDPQEVLIVDSTIYRRVDGLWVETESAPSVVALDGDGLSLLSAARDLQMLEPADDVPADFRGVRFTLHPEDVAQFVLVKQDRLDPEGVMLARLAAPAISGSGELWMDGAGLPARMSLNLSWVKEGRDPYRVHAAATTHYWDFGQRFPPERFDPAASPETGAPVAAIGRSGELPRLWAVASAGLLGLLWLLARAASGSRRAAVAVTLTLILALLAPSVAPAAHAAGLGESPAKERETEKSPPPAGSEVIRMLEQTRVLAAEHRIKDPPGQGNLLPENSDEDGDGLPNGYEIRLGTNPLSKDSDYDGLSDYDEVRGMPWEYGGETRRIETNPLDPDSNHDGLRDGDEYAGGTCGSSYEWGCAWDDDNDNDDVPDGLDLSPFSRSGALANSTSEPGPNLTFETLDQNPSELFQVPYPFYVEIQVRPVEEETLRFAYKHLYWPLDHEGPIQRPNPTEWAAWPAGSVAAQASGYLPSGGRLTLAPLLQATLRARDLPSESAMAHYGIGASPHRDEEGNHVVENGEALYDMAIPLVPVERGGQVFAFQAKMLHDEGRSNDLLRHWRDLRLKWAVTGDVEMPGVDPGPSGEYGLAVYDAPYRLTGLQVSRQGGASTLLAAALPPSEAGSLAPPPWAQRYDDGPIALLRAGMEAQFLTGGLDLADIVDRFDTPNSATDEERWGIPQTREYRVEHDTNYDHLDEAVATTTMTTTRQLLDEVFADDKDLEPTLILASEQRTSTVNLDDDPTSDYSDITINTCIKPLIISRSLQLQTYRWVPHTVVSAADGWPIGDWEPLTLDEILQKVEDEYAAVTDPLDEFYNEALNILKMATTVWHTGQSAIIALGDLLVQDPGLAL